MLGGIDATHVYIVCGYTVMRRSKDGLAAIIKQNFGCNPYDGSLFLFSGNRSDCIKGLLWDEDSFLLLYNYLIESSDHSIKNGAHYVKLGLRRYS